MTQLPNDLQSILDLARDAHDPVDPGARARVRQAIAASLALGGSGGALGGSLPSTEGVLGQSVASNTQAAVGAAKAGKLGLGFFGSKLGALAATTLAAAGIGLAVYATRPPAELRVPARTAEPASAVLAPSAAPVVLQPSPARVAPEVVAPALPAPEVEAPAVVEPAAAPARAQVRKLGKTRASSTQSGGDTLAAEMALLRAATDALTRNDASAAIAALQEHGKRFPRGSLREERDGLRAIAECSRGSRSSAASAEHFTQLYPNSLMSARIAKACAGK